jgi:hypothetical protein
MNKIVRARGYTLFEVIRFITTLVYLAGVVGAAYIVIHFIVKFW